MLTGQPKGIKTIILYHQKDAPVFESLSEHLALLRRKGFIDQWSEPSIGLSRNEQIKIRINEAKVIILLESRSFHREDNHYASPEILSLINTCAKKGAKVWPIRIKPISESIFDEQEVFFGESEKPLTLWTPQDEGYEAVTEKIRREIVQMLSEEWVQYSATCYNRNYLQDALIGYDKSLQYSSSYPPALLGKLQVFLKLSEQEEAERCLEVISSTYKQNSPYAYVKGYALLELGRLQDAQRAFQEIYQQITLSADDAERNICAEAYCGEGDVCLKLSTQPSTNPSYYYDNALTAFRNAEKFSSGYPKYLIGIGRMVHCSW